MVIAFSLGMGAMPWIIMSEVHFCGFMIRNNEVRISENLKTIHPFGTKKQ